MEDDNGMGETPCDLNSMLAQGKGLQFYQTRSNAIVLHNTLLAVCIEKAVCMKTKEELYQKVRLTPRLPRVVLKANSHSGQQDQRDQDARSSWDPPSEPKSYRETWNNAVDCRILGIPLSTVEQQDTNRQNKVKKLIEKFEMGIGIVYCSCGRNFLYSQRPKEFEKNNCDVSSIRGNVIRRIAVTVLNMDLLNDKECTTMLKRC